MMILSLAARRDMRRLIVVAQRSGLGQEATIVLLIAANGLVLQRPDAARRRTGIGSLAGRGRWTAGFGRAGLLRVGPGAGSAAGAGFSPASRPIRLQYELR